MTLEELKAKYSLGDGAKNEPKSWCKFCDGKGERFNKNSNRMQFCICLFVDHAMSDFAGDSLSATAKKLKSELTSPSPTGGK